MKIKIKDFKGIFTNLDENDSNLEAVRDSINFAHKRGFLEFVPRHLQERVNMPDFSDFPYIGQWDYEAGIYTTLTSDRLGTDLTATPTSYDVLVLISKVEDAGTYHRLIHLWDGTDWHEMSRYSSPQVNGSYLIDIINYKDSTVEFDESMFSTTIDGTAFFQVEDGRLKVYLPHCAFWIGRIERKIWIQDNGERWPYTDPGSGVVSYPYFNYEPGYWYIDRLTDYWNYDKQYIWFFDQNYPSVPTNYDPYFFRCARVLDGYEGRRLGVKYDVSINTDQTATVGETAIDIGDLHDNKLRTDTYRKAPCWTTRNNIGAVDTQIGVTCPWKPFETDPTIFTFPIDTTRTTAYGWDFDDDNDINTNSGQWSGIYLLFDEYAQSLFRKFDDPTWTWATSGWYVHTNGVTCEYPGPMSIKFGGEGSPVYSVSYQDFITFAWAYLGDQEIQDIGYDPTTDKKFGIIATMLLDDREEIPVRAEEFSFTPTDKFAIDIKNIDIPLDISKRVTRLRFYHTIKDGADFEMVKEFDFLNEDGTLKDFSFTEQDKAEGTTLAGNTGYLWDLWKRPKDLRIIQGFRSFITESGISIGLASYDLVSIFHSTFGGGNLMPDLIYDDNRLPVSGISKLTAVGNADGRLMAFTDNTAYAIEAEEVSGIIGFRIEDTVELGVKNQQDIANIQGGVAVHTRHGIYITNGFETKSISEPIDNLIEQYYSAGRIYYNRFKHILYYKPSNAEDLYRYRFKDNVWERINKTTSEGIVQEEEALD